MKNQFEVNSLAVLFNNIQLKEIMKLPPIVAKIDDPFHIVAEKLQYHQIKHLPVVDEDGCLKGLMTLRDLYRLQSPRKLMDGSLFYNQEDLDRFILSHVMIKDPFAFQAHNSIGEAIIKMSEGNYGCVPIVDENHVMIGIVTQSDIIKIISKTLQSNKL